MKNAKIVFVFCIFVIHFSSICNALDCSKPPKIINVNKAGGLSGTFTTIQSAIDSVPVSNNQWFQIKISAETYA